MFECIGDATVNLREAHRHLTARQISDCQTELLKALQEIASALAELDESCGPAFASEIKHD